MIKGVTRRIVEIKNPADGYFERAVLYLRADVPPAGKREALRHAEEYLSGVGRFGGKTRRDLRPIVALLGLALMISLTALGVMLIVVTKM